MKSEDLMIGDWFMTTYPDNVIEYRKVESISPPFVTFKKNNNITKMAYSCTTGTEPIPLTIEILEKFGFKYLNGYATMKIDDSNWLEYYFHEHRLRRIWCGVDEWQNHSKVREMTFICTCHYVHELQHALRMCKINKEIKL